MTTSLVRDKETGVWLKMEHEQRSGSFKYRGISRVVLEAKQKGQTIVVSSSGGNAGLAAAVAARENGMSAEIFVPLSTSAYMITLIESAGAKVRQVGEHWAEANEVAIARVDESCCFVHPFAGPEKETLWLGHASLVSEIKEQLNGIVPEAIVLSCGGGGLLMGVRRGLEAVGWLSDVAVVAVETRGADSLNQSVANQALVKLKSIQSVCKSLGAVEVTPEALEWALEPSSRLESLVVSDDAALDAVEEFRRKYDKLVEPACGAALAVASQIEGDNVVIIVCGGSNINDQLLAQYRQDAF